MYSTHWAQAGQRACKNSYFWLQVHAICKEKKKKFCVSEFSPAERVQRSLRCQKSSAGSRQCFLGHRRGGAEAAGKFGGLQPQHPRGQCTSGSSRGTATPRQSQGLKGFWVFCSCFISLGGEGEGRSRMSKRYNSSMGRRVERDKGVAESPLSSGTCLQMSSNDEVASPGWQERIQP